MNDPTKRPDEVSSVEREHESLKKLLGDAKRTFHNRLVGADDVEALIEAFAGRLNEHFAEEERTDGCFETVVRDAPRLQARVASLRLEHQNLREILHHLKLKSLGGDGSDIWWERLEDQYDQLSSALLAHESKECQLLQDAYLQDIGSQD